MPAGPRPCASSSANNNPNSPFLMNQIMVPRKLMVCKLADGHLVRVIDLNQKTDKVRVKSLRTGLPFSIQRAFLFQADTPAV